MHTGREFKVPGPVLSPILYSSKKMAAATADVMQTARANSELPEAIPGTLSQRSVLCADALEGFSLSLAENIVHSFLQQLQASQLHREHEALAEVLASAVMEAALAEAFTSPSQCAGEEETEDVYLDLIQERHTPSRAALYKSGLPVVGSLDYPDAPPTTPLLPELQRSRSSFARKLKGGLAKVFLPAPPPPTPKEKEEMEDGIDSTTCDPQVELMEHLMQSLSVNHAAAVSLETVTQPDGARVEAFAEDLSCELLNWVMSVKSRKESGFEQDLHLLAHQLAEAVVSSSLDSAQISAELLHPST